MWLIFFEVGYFHQRGTLSKPWHDLAPHLLEGRFQRAGARHHRLAGHVFRHGLEDRQTVWSLIVDHGFCKSRPSSMLSLHVVGDLTASLSASSRVKSVSVAYNLSAEMALCTNNGSIARRRIRRAIAAPSLAHGQRGPFILFTAARRY